MTAGVLLELGLHNPLAAAIGLGGQSEWALALELLAQLPAQALLLADRLHGCAACAAQALAACQKVGSHFLIRARSDIHAKVLRRYKDSSRLVRLPVRQKGNRRRITHWLELREIRVRVQRAGHRAQELRLWTSLLDPPERPGICDEGKQFQRIVFPRLPAFGFFHRVGVQVIPQGYQWVNKFQDKGSNER